MKTNGFTKLNKKEQSEIYGGWAWLVALIPLLVEAVTSSVGAFKAIGSTNGSIKGKNFDTHWDNKISSNSKASKITYYAY